MWTSMMVLGLLAVFGLPDLGRSADTDPESPDDDAPDVPESDSLGRLGSDFDMAGPEDAPDDDGPDADAPDSNAGREVLAGGKPGLTVIEGFQPGSDSLNLRLPGDASEFWMDDAGEDGGAALSYAALDDVTEVRFDGLDTVPVDDIWVLVDGEGEPIPLSVFLEDAELDQGEEDALPPDDPEAPTDPDDSGDSGAGLPPDDPEAPTDSDDSGDSDAGLPPDDPEVPTVPDDSGDSDAGLPPDDPEAPTVPDDSGDGDAGLPPDDPEAPTVPDDSGDGDAGLPPDDPETPTDPDDGGADGDTLVLSAGDLAAGGNGADLFWIYPEDSGMAPAIITDFEPGEDLLRLTLVPGAAGDVAVVPSEDGTAMLVQIGGQTVAVMPGATGASLDDLYVEVRDEIHI